MRTMNKIVALSLVLAMAFSMMASAASFKDQATINEDLIDEINMMLALNVYSEQGTGAGYFEPNGTITRAQAAKIIYVLKNKGIDNGATSWTGLNIFTDVEAGAWYEGYVNYCASTGIIAGVGDNKFAPNGTLTGVELAKMLLVVIGYKADLEGYTGAKWDANILADAEAAGFFVDYELPVRGVVTREWAAKMIVNAINAIKVKYEDGEAVEMYNQNNNPITYANQDLGLKEVTGIATGTAKMYLNAAGAPTLFEDGKTSRIEVTTNAGTHNEYLTYDIPVAMLGQDVKVLYKDANNNGLDAADKIYGVTATTVSKVYEVALADITFGKTGNAYTKFKFAGYNDGEYKTFAANDTVTVYDDFYAAEMSIASLANYTATPYTVKLIDKTGNGTIDTVVTSIPTIAEVKAYRADKFVFATKNDSNNDNFDVSAEKEFAKFNFVDEIAKGDIVKVSYDYTSGKLVYNIEKLDSVSGKVTKYNSDKSYVINDETYKTSFVKMTFDAIEGVTTTEETFYVDGNYVVFTKAVTAKEDQSNIALLLAKNGTANDAFAPAKVQILKADGTKEIVEYAVITSNVPTGYKAFNTVNENKAYEVVVSGEKIYFKDLATVADGNNLVLNKGENATTLNYSTSAKGKMTLANVSNLAHTGTSTVDAQNNNLIDENAFFFMKKGDSWKVLKASEITSNITDAKVEMIAVSAKGVPTIKYGVITLTQANWPTSTSTGMKFGVLASKYTSYTDSNNNSVVEIGVTNIDGTTDTLIIKATDFDTTDVKKLVSYKVTDGYAKADVAVKADTSYFLGGALTAVSGNTLYINDSMRTAADDMKIYTVDYNATAGTLKVVEGNELVLRDTDLTEGNNVLFSWNSDSTKIDMIIVEVDGEAIAGLVK